MLDEILVASTKARLEELDVEETRRSAVVQSIKDRIAALEVDLREAKRAHLEIVKERRRVFAPLAPVSRLPYEILARIFMLGNDGYRGYVVVSMTRSEIYWALHYPIRLSHVNRQLRHVAITTAALWTNIYIRRYPLRPRTTLYLSRSRGCLLDIRVSRLLDCDLTAEMDELFKVLLPADRWQSLRINVDFHHMRSFMERVVGPATNLKILELKGHRYHGEGEEEQLLNPFEGQNPLLSSMTMRKASSRWGPGMFSSLKDLSMKFSDATTHMVIQDHLNLLQHTRHLKTLRIMGDEGAILGDDSPVPHIVRLEELEAFTIGAMEAAPIHFILSSLCMPALTHLTLESWDWDVYDEPIAFLTQAPLPTLKRLSLLGVKRPSWSRGVLIPDATRFIRSFPNVDTLDFLKPGDNRDILFQFIAAMSGPEDIAFPKLQRLRFYHCSESDSVQVERFLQRWTSRGIGPLTVMLPVHYARDEVALAPIRRIANIETFVAGELREQDSWMTDNGDYDSDSNGDYDSDGMYGDDDNPYYYDDDY